MRFKDSTTIRERLPYDYQFGKPLYYCSGDDTLHTSLEECAVHAKRLEIDNLYTRVNEIKMEAEDCLRTVRVLKMETLPELQKRINFFKTRLRELLADKDWKSSFSTHAAKRREILKLRFRRMECASLLNEKVIELSHLKKSYEKAKKEIAEYEQAIEKREQEKKSLEEWWAKSRKEKKS